MLSLLHRDGLNSNRTEHIMIRNHRSGEFCTECQHSLKEMDDEDQRGHDQDETFFGRAAAAAVFV
jgi:hypothetical protein